MEEYEDLRGRVMTDHTEWPREIWMREREKHDQGVVTAVLSEAATIARWKGDKGTPRIVPRFMDYAGPKNRKGIYRGNPEPTEIPPIAEDESFQPDGYARAIIMGET